MDRRWKYTLGFLVLCGTPCSWFLWAMDADYGDYGSVRRSACHSALKLVAMAHLMYAELNDQRFVPSTGWRDRLVKNDKANGTLSLVHDRDLRCRCLRARDTDSDYGYAYNAKLSSIRVGDVENPDRIPLVYESDDWSRNATDPATSFPGPFDPAVRSSRRANMAYVSGRTERVIKK